MAAAAGRAPRRCPRSQLPPQLGAPRVRARDTAEPAERGRARRRERPRSALPLAVLAGRGGARAVLGRGAAHAGGRRHRDHRPHGAPSRRGHHDVGPALRLAARGVAGRAVRGGAAARRPRALRLVYFLLGLGADPAAYALGARARPARRPARGGARWPARRRTSCCSRRCRRPCTRRRCCSSRPCSRWPCASAPRLAAGGRRVRGLVAWGALAGLALWTHLMTAHRGAVAARWLLAAAPRPPRARCWPARASRCSWRSAPLVGARARGDRRPSRIVSVSGRRAGARRAPARGRCRACTSRWAGCSARTSRWSPTIPTTSSRAPRVVAGRRRPRLWRRPRARVGRAGATARRRRARAACCWPRRRWPCSPFPFPLRSGAGHDPLPDAALPARRRARGLGRGRARAAARRAWIVVLVAGRAAPRRAPRACSTAWRAADRAAAPFLLPDLAPVRARARGARHPPRLRVVRPRLSPDLRERRARSSPRSPGTSASSTTRCRTSTRCASRRTWPGS